MAHFDTILVTVPPGAAGERLDRFLGAQPGFSRTLARRLIDAGAVFVQGTRIRRASRPISPGEVIRAPRGLPPLCETSLGPRVLHQDRHLLVVDKPPGVPSAPTPLGVRGTLPELLREQLGLGQLPLVVHRLDRDVSGVMALALTREGARRLTLAFEHKNVRKHYRAIVWGAPPLESGTVEAPLGRDPARRGRMRVAPGGDPARTDFRRLGEVPGYGGCHLLELRLHTGRTHQIRVHLAHLGCPIVGDRFYGGPLRVTDETGRTVAVPRLCLHSARLELPLADPDGPLSTFEAPLPELLPPLRREPPP